MTSFDRIKTILDYVAATGTYTETHLTALLEALLVGGKGNVILQIGKYNVYIEQGQDIQIGDHIYQGSDAEAIHRTILQMLEEYRLRPGIPFMVPPLPEHFVPRPEVINVLKARLLADSPIPGILAVSAIHGLGGIGKSTLAGALGYDPEVQRRFKDGILWATLGQQPDLLSLLNGWVQALGDYNFRPTTVEAASTHLRSLLHDKAALLVVDDAWDPAHPGFFRVGGSHCQVVITTRETLVAQVVGAMLYDLDVMTPTQSLALLAGRLRRNLTVTEQDQALVLAKEVGCLPLALELAAAQIADGLPWAELLTDLQAEIARLEVLSLAEGFEIADEASRKRLSLLASFDLSLRRLPTEARQQFVWLGVLPEDGHLTSTMATTLWETDERKASETLRYLRGKALLLPGVSRPDGALTYRLHDLLHHLARRLITAPVEPAQTHDLSGLGLTLATAHAILLDRYRTRTSNKLWHTLPDDSYIHTHLTWHMEQAGQIEQIHTLLQEEMIGPKNGWHEACQRLGQTSGFLQDIARAWRLVESSSGARIPNSKEIGLQIRYALMTSTLTSLAENLPTAFLSALAEKGIWSPVQALAYARQIREPYNRIVALAKLLAHLPEALQSDIQDEILTTIRAVEDHNQRAGWLKEVAPHFSEPTQTQLFKEFLEAVQAIEGSGVRLLTQLCADLLDLKRPAEAIVAAQAIQMEWSRIVALFNILPHLPDSDQQNVRQQVEEVALRVFREQEEEAPEELGRILAEFGYLEEAQIAAQRVKYENERVRALSDVTYYLTEISSFQKVLEVAETIQEKSDKVALITLLASRMAKYNYAQQALEILTQMFKGKKEKAIGLAYLAAELTEPLKQDVLRQALEIARSIEDPAEEITALVTIVPHLSSDMERIDVLIEIGTALVWTWGDSQPNDYTLVQLVLRLGEAGLFGDAIEVAGRLSVFHPFRTTQAEAVRKLVLRLAELGRIEEALMTAQFLSEGSTQISALASLAPHMSKSMLEEVLANTWKIGDEKACDAGLGKMALMLAELENYKEARSAVKTIHWHYGKEFARVALHVFDPLLPKILAEAHRAEFETSRGYQEGEFPPSPILIMKEEDDQARSLKVLAPYLTEASIYEALAITREFANQGARRIAEVALVPRLAGLGHTAEALDLALAFEDNWTRMLVLTELAQLLAFADIQDELIEEARKSAWAIDKPWDRLMALPSLMPLLPSNLREEVFQETQRILEFTTDEKLKGTWLIFASRSPEFEDWHNELYKKILAIIKNAGHNWTKVDLLCGLAPDLPAFLLQEALDIAQSIVDETDRANVLKDLIVRQAELGYYQEALRAARNYPIATRLQTFRSLILAELAQIPGLIDHRDELFQEALEAAQAVDKHRRGQAVLPELIPHLPKTLLPKAKLIAQEVESEKVLKLLALRLIEFEQYKEALEIAQEIDDERAKITILMAILPKVTGSTREQLLQDALTIIQEISYLEGRTDAIVQLAPLLPEDQRETILQSILAELEESWNTQALIKLAQCPIPESLIPEVFEKVRMLVDDKERITVFEKLIPNLPDHLQEEAVREELRALRSYGKISDDSVVLEKLAPQVAIYLAEQGNLEGALSLCQEIQSKDDQVQVLIKLALLSNYANRREELLGKALEFAHNIQSIELLTELMKHFSEEKLSQILLRRDQLLREKLSEALAIEYKGRQVKALAELVEYLPDFEQNHLLIRIFRLVFEMDRDSDRAEILAELAKSPAFTGWKQALANEALDIARKIQPASDRASTLTKVIPSLPEFIRNSGLQMIFQSAQSTDRESWEETMTEVLPCIAEFGYSELALNTVLEKMNQEKYKWEAFVGVIPHLPNNMLPKALEVARTIADKDYRWEALNALGPRLTEWPSDQLQQLLPVWEETLHFLATHTRRIFCFYDLYTLAPVIPTLGGVEAVSEVGHAIQEVRRWWP